jgi:Ca2+-binding RTX toxin-like protein
LLVALLALVVASGVALADNISGSGGNDDIFGKDGRDSLFGGNDGDALQGGLGEDDLFGQRGSDFVNAIDGQASDSVDCRRGANDVAGIDNLSQVGSSTDDVSEECEDLYIPTIVFGGASARSSGAGVSNITSLKEAEHAVGESLLRTVERSGASQRSQA